MAKESLYLIQPAFTTGEVSPEVANRVDLQQFQSALLQAKNVYIRPYGAAYKRGGSMYCGKAKYPDKDVLLYSFVINASRSFLLEIGDLYIRIWNGDVYTGIELVTQFKESELKNLRFCQSADVLYIASGTHPVYELDHYSDTDWRIKQFEFSSQYFDISLASALTQVADEKWTNAGEFTYTAPESGNYVVSVAGGGGGGGGWKTYSYYQWRGGQNGGTYKTYKTLTGGKGGSGQVTTATVYLTKGTTYTGTIGQGGTAGKEDTKGTDGDASTAFGVTAIGGGGGGLTYGRSVDYGRGTTRIETVGTKNGTSYGSGGAGGAGGENGSPGWVTIRFEGSRTLTPSDTHGEITLTANGKFFTKTMEGAWIKLSQEMPSQTVSLTAAGTTDPIRVGTGWKIITHGTWTGSVKIQKSTDYGPWKDFREYKSNGDSNVSESGTVTESGVQMRMVTTAGRADLTSLAYTNEGVVQIKTVNSETKATCIVKKELGSVEAVSAYTLGSWNEEFGYPRCVCFFQDRLCFAATKKQPFMVWMSRTGDYPNFGVEKVSGTVTDDSAVALSFVSRNQVAIKHIVPANDLIVMTDGNEWTVSGSETVTPTKATPRVQTSRGCTDVLPILIGNRIVFVQRRGETVRDMGYNFEADAYDGMDLTLLAKHLGRGKHITNATYMQDPDSRIYFTESDGTMNVLAYVQDQKVYAWSHLETDGKIISACNIENSDADSVYCAVRRTINGEAQTYIERLENYQESTDPMDYINLDSAARLAFDEATTQGYVPHLAGKTIGVLAGGRYFENIEVDTDGNFEIPTAYTEMIAGLPYEMIMELPNVESNTQQGTLQGRKKKISRAILRLVNSLGGNAGGKKSSTNEIKYDEFQHQKISLYTGDKELTMPNPGFMNEGRVYIESKDPYPFNLAAIIREMELYE